MGSEEFMEGKEKSTDLLSHLSRDQQAGEIV